MKWHKENKRAGRRGLGGGQTGQMCADWNRSLRVTLSEKVDQDLTRVRISAKEDISQGRISAMDTKCSRSIPDSGNSQSRGPEAGSARGASRNSKWGYSGWRQEPGGGTQDPGQGGKEMSLSLFFIYLCVYVCVLQRSFPSLSLIFQSVLWCLCLTEMLSLI